MYYLPPQPSGETKESKYLLLLISILALAVLIPIRKELNNAGLSFFGETLVVDVLFVVVMIFGVQAVASRRRLKLIGTGLWVVALVAYMIEKVVFQADGLTKDMAKTIADVMILAGLIMLTWLILRDLFRAGLGMTRDRLRGAACAYLLMGMSWALAYTLVDTWITGSFVLSEELAEVVKQAQQVDIEVQHWVYYSFVTLTTLGYGDVTPVRPLAQTLAFLEACVGQFYLTVLVAMLVGQRLAAWMSERSRS